MYPQFSGWFLWAEQRFPLAARSTSPHLSDMSVRMAEMEGLTSLLSALIGDKELLCRLGTLTWVFWRFEERLYCSTAAHSLSYEPKMESGPFKPWIDSSLDMETWSSRADHIDLRVRDSGNKGQIKQMALSQKLSATVLLIFLFYCKPLSRSWLTVTTSVRLLRAAFV